MTKRSVPERVSGQVALGEDDGIFGHTVQDPQGEVVDHVVVTLVTGPQVQCL